VQWGLLYGAGAWGLLQGLQYVSDAFQWPPAVRQVALLAALVGLPVVLVLAWYHGDRGEQRFRGTEVAIIALLFLVGGGIFWVYERGRETPAAAGAQETVVDPAQSVRTAPPDAKSIAVLPFVNMSSDKEQEYFSDGLTEEVLNLLVKLPDLKVIARTSSFAYKGKDTKIADIARELNVAHILEGSVRKAGDRIRVTAQLIHAADSSHLWSETYDRTLEDVFEVQDDIANKVVKALDLTLRGKQGQASLRPTNVAAYNLMLQGQYLMQRRTEESYAAARKYLERSLKEDNSYAPTWAALAYLHVFEADDGYVSGVDGYARGRKAAQRALELNPELATAHIVMAWIQGFEFDWVSAEQSARRALALEPNNAVVLRLGGVVTAELGQSDEGVAILRRAIELDPLDEVSHSFLAAQLVMAGHPEEAEPVYRRARDLNGDPTSHAWGLAEALLNQGRASEALLEAQRSTDEAFRDLALATIHHSLGRGAESDAALTRVKANYGDQWPFYIATVHAFRTETDLAFEWLERAYKAHDPYLCDFVRTREMGLLKVDPRYDAFRRKLGFPDNSTT
jgi:TolB-like protein/Tfp pilus assembly protein PilF